jgi:hypothetical protein
MKYFNLVFTLHAQDQTEAREIKLAEVWETIKHPTSIKSGKYGGKQFEREYENYKITAVAVQNKEKEWVVKSVWRNPPLPDTADYKEKKAWRKYNKASTLGKIWIEIKNQLGIRS